MLDNHVTRWTAKMAARYQLDAQMIAAVLAYERHFGFPFPEYARTLQERARLYAREARYRLHLLIGEED